MTRCYWLCTSGFCFAKCISLLAEGCFGMVKKNFPLQGIFFHNNPPPINENPNPKWGFPEGVFASNYPFTGKVPFIFCVPYKSVSNFPKMQKHQVKTYNSKPGFRLPFAKLEREPQSNYFNMACCKWQIRDAKAQFC